MAAGDAWRNDHLRRITAPHPARALLALDRGRAMRRAARVDANQDQIVTALRAAGASVSFIGQPVDLLVGLRGRTFLVECKNPESRYGKKGLNENQRKFRDEWRGGPVVSITSAEMALRALELIA
jgi:hypothetical protein